MKKIAAKITSFFGQKTVSQKNSDFSDFFMKKSGDKKKVITQILREANKEQRKIVEEYRKQLNGI